MDDLISRQAAIDFVAEGQLCNPNEPRWSDNEVVNFLKSRPSAQPDIARDIATILENEQDMRVILQNAQPERKTGKWDTECRTIHGHKFPVFACSECGKESIDEYKFCPNCGAAMEVEE